MSQETILVVDDNLEIAQYLSEVALPGMGYRTLVAHDGKGAIKYLRSNSDRIDLMVLDLQLPDVDGLELLRKLDSEGRSIPTILFTAHGSEQVAVEAFLVLRISITNDVVTEPHHHYAGDCHGKKHRSAQDSFPYSPSKWAQRDLLDLVGLRH
jgi:CheY-like chemotaxis protein